MYKILKSKGEFIMKDKKLMAMIAGTAAVAGVATLVGVKSIRNLKNNCCENDSSEDDLGVSVEGYSEENSEKIMK